MEFRIIHGPAPQSDLNFVRAGTLRVAPQTIEFRGKWQMVMPDNLALVWMLLYLPVFFADHWIPQAWQIGVVVVVLWILKITIVLLFLLYTMRLPKKVTADRKTLREIARTGREVTFLLRDAKGRDRRPLFNTDTEEEAAVIETVLRESGTERTFTITYGFAAPHPIKPVPGQIAIKPDHVRLDGIIRRDPQPGRHDTWLIVFLVAAGMILFLVIGSAISMSPYVRIVFMILYPTFLVLTIVLYLVWRMRKADVSKAEITDIRQQDQEVSFRAPLEGDHDVSRVTTVFQADSPEQAVAIAQALATRTEDSARYTVNYGTERETNTFGFVHNGKLSVQSDVVVITGYRLRRREIGLFALSFVLSVFVVAWLVGSVVQDLKTVLVIACPVIVLIVSIAHNIIIQSSRGVIPRQDIIAVERSGRQLTLHVQIAEQEEQAVFHARTEEEAAALSEALSG